MNSYSSLELFLSDEGNLVSHMRRALELAEMSNAADVPIGSLIVSYKDNKIVAEASNTRQQTGDATEHAEIKVIRETNQLIGDWRLNGYVVFTTLEPCIMCAATLMQTRIGAVVYGASDPQYGAAGSIYNFFEDKRLNHNATAIGGILGDECSAILKEFFVERRRKNKEFK